LPVTLNVPVTVELASNSMLPVPTVLISKLLLLAVVSIRLPTICMSSVRNGPPTISPTTVKVPVIVVLPTVVVLPETVKPSFIVTTLLKILGAFTVNVSLTTVVSYVVLPFTVNA
jgi:hypothetical protein